MTEAASTRARAESPSDNGDEQIDLRRLMDILIAGKWLIAATTVVALAFGMVQAKLATPIYQADVLLQIEKRHGAMPGLDRGYMPEREPVEAEIEILRSRMVAGLVVDRLDLQIMAEPERAPVLGSALARGQSAGSPANPPFDLNGFDWLDLTRYGWGGETLQVERLDGEAVVNRGFTLVAQEPGHYALYDGQETLLLNGRVGETAVVEGDTESEPALEIFVSELDARPGTHFTVVKRDRLSMARGLRGRLQVGEKGVGTGILVLTMEGENPERLRVILDEVANVYLRQNIERRSAEAQKSLDFLDSQLPQLRANLEDAEDEYNEFRAEHQAVDLTAETQQLLSELVEVESELARLEMERVEARQRYGEQHPRIQTLRRQEAALRDSQSELTGRVENLPEKQQQALRLRRQMEVSADLYTSLLTTAQELRVAQAGTVGSVRIVDEAVVSGPVSPRTGRMMAASLMLGLGVGVAGVFGRQVLRRSVQDPDQLERQFDLSVRAVVPHSGVQASADRRAKRRGAARPVLARDNPQEPAAEAIRSLRTSLHFGLAEGGGKLIAFTSPGPRCGKSFVCVNLAWLMGETERRVLLIDADMRRGRLHDYLQHGRSPGLSEVLNGQRSFEEALVPLACEAGRVDVIPTGMLPPNPSELLMGARFRDLLKQAQERYDIVIIDTPPTLAVTDAAIVGGYTGGVFVVVRAGVTAMGEVEPTLRCLRQNGSPPKGFLVNDFNQSGHSAAYYHTYHYPTAKA